MNHELSEQTGSAVPLPTQGQLALPLLTVLAEAGPMRGRAAADAIAERLNLPDNVRNRTTRVGNANINVFDRAVRWTHVKTRLRGLTKADDAGRWSLTSEANAALEPSAPGIVVTIFESDAGVVLWGEAEAVEGILEPRSIDLVLTSPPYDLPTQKEYGGRRGHEYENWLVARVAAWKDLLTPTGSIMLNLGDAWIPNQPSQSIYQESILIRLVRELGLSLLQRLYWTNPAKPPSPAEWVTVRRMRVTPVVESIFWLGMDPHAAKGSNRKLLRPYSDATRKMIAKGTTNAGRRPSGYAMNATSFAADRGGAIATNLFTHANTVSNDAYSRGCREHGNTLHPARMPIALARDLITLATDEGDTVFDPFGGSLTTLAAATELRRNAVTCDIHRAYLTGGLHRLSTAS